MTIVCQECGTLVDDAHSLQKYCSRICRQRAYERGTTGEAGTGAPAVASDWSWRDQAACLGMDSDLFFPEVDQTGKNRSESGRAVCAECPVQVECRDYAIANQIRFGIWGGTSNAMRRKMRVSGTRAPSLPGRSPAPTLR